MKRLIPFFLLALLVAPLISACNQTGKNGDHTYRLAPLVQMPHKIRQAPRTVREAYQFAAYNAEVLQQLPCYCGCGAMGHVSNYSCYVSGRDEDGQLVYDSHALDCRICVDITQDAMRLLDEGKHIEEIYDVIVATYSEYGPPTSMETH